MSGVNLYGGALAPRELRRRFGRLDQVAGIELFVFDEGPACGVRTLRWKLASIFSMVRS